MKIKAEMFAVAPHFLRPNPPNNRINIYPLVGELLNDRVFYLPLQLLG